MQKRSILRWEPEFIRRVLMLALPMTLQSIVTALMQIVDNLMIGQMGQLELAAVTQANRVSFLFQLTMFGTVGGVSVFVAQYWGTKNMQGIHRSMAMGLRAALCVASLFALPALLIPEKLLGILLTNEQAVALGAEYLRIAAFVYYVQALSLILSAVMKSTEKAKLPMLAGISAIVVNTCLNWLLIFDHGWIGGYGVRGAALATLTGALVELSLLLAVGWKKQMATAVSWSQLRIDMPGFVKKYLVVALPIMLNECLWSLGVTCYSVVYGHMGDGVSAVAAISIFTNVEQLAMVAMRGMNYACGVLIGIAVGRGDRDEAMLISKRMRLWTVIVLEISGAIMLLLAPSIVGLFNVETDTATNAIALLRLFAAMIWLHGLYTVIIVGILRAGGDVRFSAVLDVLPVWVIGVPLVATTGLVFHWPIYWVYAMTYVVNLIQATIGHFRIRSGKWIRNLVHD